MLETVALSMSGTVESQNWRWSAASSRGLLLCETHNIFKLKKIADRKTSMLHVKVLPDPTTPWTRANNRPESPCKQMCERKASVTSNWSDKACAKSVAKEGLIHATLAQKDLMTDGASIKIWHTL